MEFNNFGLKCSFAHIHKNMELPLNLSIRGVKNKCVNKLYVMHMTDISHNNKRKSISSVSRNPELPDCKPGTSGFARQN
jgi:hypothetical protein